MPEKRTYTRHKRANETWGATRKLPSGRYQASYVNKGQRYTAPSTFDALTDARGWLTAQRVAIQNGTWVSPDHTAAKKAASEQTLAAYAADWIKTRTNAKGEPLRPRTREEYERLLRAPGTRDPEDKGGPIAPLLELPLDTITPAQVRTWRTELLNTGKLTTTGRAYDLVKSILKTAVDDGILDRNPCQVRGGSSTATGRKVVPPTDAELDVIIDSIAPRFRALVIIAAAAGLRFGEVTALRARDVTIAKTDTGEVDSVRITVARQFVRTAKGIIPSPPKSDAGIRSVTVFGADAVEIARHARRSIGDALLFPGDDGEPLAHPVLWRAWDRARRAAGRPDLPLHALRHYAGTRYAQAGATMRETMSRLGQSTLAAAARYQHSSSAREDDLARRVAR